MAKETIFLTGATGYIGGSVLWRLLQHKDASNFNFRILVRSAEKAKVFKEKFGIDAVVGSYQDEDKLESLASEADYIFETADAANVAAAKAILRGAKRFKERTGKTSFLIHTSGTGTVADSAAGMFTSERIYDDASASDIASLSAAHPFTAVDVAITAADTDGYAKTYIISPSTIYGIVKNGFTEAGLQHAHSIQVPMIIRASLGRGQGGMVGLGKNKWPNVYVEDVADLYIVLFDKIRANPNGTPHGREGYYFGASGEHLLYDVSKIIAEVLVSIGKGKTSEPTTFTKEDIDKYFGGSDFMGSNSRVVAIRSLSIGWRPLKSTPDFLASIRPEVEAFIAQNSA